MPEILIAEREVRRFGRRCYAFGVLRRCAAVSTALLFTAGLALLVARGLGGDATPWIRSFAALWLAATAISAVLARRRTPPRAALRAALDARNGCNGLLLTAAETPLGEWAARLPPARAPRVVWRARRALSALAAAAVFVLAAAFVPIRAPTPAAFRPLEVRDTARALERRIAEMEEAALIEPAEAETLRAQLERAAEEAAGHDPAKTWEMLDHLSARAEDAARDALAELRKESAAAADAAARLAEILSDPQSAAALAAAPDPAREELLRELESALRAGDTGALLDPEVAAWLAEALKDGGGFTEDQLRRLAEALRESGANLAERLAQAQSIRIADPAEIEELIEALRNAESNGGNANGDLELIALPLGAPGRGGISRGGAPTELTFRDEASSAEGVEFKPVALPRGELTALHDSRRVGVSAAAPETGPAETASAPGALGAPGDGGEGRRHVLLPRHRAAVRRYFERTSGETP